MHGAHVIAALFVGLLVGVGGASGHANGSILYGAGTAVIDGSRAGGEWDGARRLDFGARLPSHDGGGTVAATIRAMNDGSTLYVSLEVGRSTFGGNTTFALYFDNDHDGVREQGDDVFFADVGQFSPARFVDSHWTSCVPGGPGLHCPTPDEDRGGTKDGVSAAGIAAGAAVIEASHPFDSADDSHDFSLGPGSVAGYAALVTLYSADTNCNFGETCYAHTVVPIGLPSHGETTGYGHLVISPDVVPPETALTGGPPDEEMTNAREASFAVAGTDNLTPDNEIRFSCSLDDAVFPACGSRLTFTGLAEGDHRLQVRAIDELGNVDQTPAVRRWTVDATPPETSIAGAPRDGSLTKRRVATFELAGADDRTPSNRLRFICRLDDRPVAPCTGRIALQRVSDGRHRFDAWSLDAAGNVDPSPASHGWTIDGTPPSRPRIRIRLRGRLAHVRLSAIDAAGGPVRYRCSLDGNRFRACRSSFVLRVGRGRHALRAIALDRLGNRSRVRTARFRTPARRR